MDWKGKETRAMRYAGVEDRLRLHECLGREIRTESQ